MISFLLPIKNPNKKLKISEGSINEKKLVNGLKNGGKQYVEELYKLYAPSLMGIIINIVKYDEIAEDVLQDTFLKIWKSIAQYDSSKGRLFTWMANLAKNTAIDQLKTKHSKNSSKTDDINNTVDLDYKNPIHFNTDIIGMQQLIFNLKPDQEKILNMVYFKGYTHAEVAEQLNIPLGTIKTKIRLSIIELRKYFEEKSKKPSIV
jgi:RNA polymerase sigma factor (sigma-70 family)